MPRDIQKSKVYAWERRIFDRKQWTAEITLEELARFCNTIWRAERGRVGLARMPAPTVKARRGSSAEAWGRSKMEFGTHCHNRIVALHELAHCLTPKDADHGPRFVGVLIGLYCRHLDYDANELMGLADEMGVKYYVRTIGNVPVHGSSWHVEKAVREQGPMTEMDLACWCDITYLQARGAALHLIRQGKARWLRKKLVLIGDAAPQPKVERKPRPTPAVMPRNKQQQTRALAKRIGAEIDHDGGDAAIWVYPPAGLFTADEDDPYHDEHYCDTWGDALERVKAYEQRKYPGGIATDNPGEA